MMGRAYAYADGNGSRPNELYFINAIDRFGVEAVLGRAVLGAKEIRLMTIAENVVEAYKERDNAEDFGAWAVSNPEKSDMLVEAMNQAVKFGYLQVKHA